MNHDSRVWLIAGGTGYIGRAVVKALAAQGLTLRILTRDVARARACSAVEATWLGWDATQDELREAWLHGVEGIINLAGENVGTGWWTEARKRVLLASRLEATSKLVGAGPRAGVKVFLNASAVAWYGDSDAPVDERAPAGDTWMSALARRQPSRRPARAAGW